MAKGRSTGIKGRKRRNRIKNRGRRYHMRYIIRISLATVVALWVIVSGILLFALSAYPKDLIADNIYIGDVAVGGMTKEEAKSALKSKLKNLKSVEITLTVDDKSQAASLKNLGLKYKDADDLVDQAFNYGKKGGLFSRYRKMHSLEKKSHEVAAVFTLKEKKAKAFLNEKSSDLVVAAENAKLTTTKKGKIKVQDAKEGKKIDVKASVKKIVQALNNNWDGSALSVEMKVTKERPSLTADDLKEMTDVLGTYTTYVGTGDKRTNVETGTSRLNGIVLQPGEELAADETMGPYDEEHGYTLGNSYAGSEVEQTYGGGVCQVTSTLYNAVLYAELEVVERHNHSMQVTYVDPARDAAVATGVMEFRIKNNYDSPIYISGEIDSDDNLTFTIYGKDTRDKGRTIEFESEVLSTEEYDTTYVTDSEAALGSMEYTGAASNGMSAELWKIVYEDGVEVSRDIVNTSEYTKSDQIISVGIACDNASASALVSSAVSSQDASTITSAISQASAMLY